jgi:hypothetical protein
MAKKNRRTKMSESQVVPQRIFFHIHPLVIEKMRDAFKYIHDIPPSSIGLPNVLTSVGEL